MDQVEIITISLLRVLEIPAHIAGYQFIKTAVHLIKADPSLLQRVTRELYPAIAHAHSTTPSKTERGIRHALALATDDESIRKKVLGTARKGITNSHFLAALTESVGIDLINNLKKETA